jgi:hypothetical protein
MSAAISDHASSSAGKILTLDTLNPGTKAAYYSIRGTLYLMSLKIEKELKEVCGIPFFAWLLMTICTSKSDKMS